MEALTFIGSYIVGIVLTMWILHKFSKELHLDQYDEPKTYVTADDWDSKNQAITVFSIFWPFIVLFGSIALPVYLIYKLSEIIGKSFEKE